MQYYKTSEKNKRKSLCDLGFGGEFLATHTHIHTHTHNLQYMKEKIGLDLIKNLQLMS